MSQSSESSSSYDEPMVTENSENEPDEDNFKQFESKFLQRVRTSIQDLKIYSESMDSEKITKNNLEIELKEGELKQLTFAVKDQIKMITVKLNFYQEMIMNMEDQLEYFQNYYNDLIDKFNAMEIKRSILQNQISSNNAKCDEVANLYIGLCTDLENEIEIINNQLKEFEVERNYYLQCHQETQQSLLSMENDQKCQQEDMKNVDLECQKMTELQKALEALKCTENELMTELGAHEKIITANGDSNRDSKNKLFQLEIKTNQLAEQTQQNEDFSKAIKEKIANLNMEIINLTDEKFNEILKKLDQENRETAKNLNENLKISEQEELNLKEEEAQLNAVMLKLDNATKEYAAKTTALNETESAITESEKSHFEYMRPLQLQLENYEKEAKDLEKTLMETTNALEEDKLTFEMKLADERSKNEELMVQIESDRTKSFGSNHSSLLSDDDRPNFKEKMNVISTRENIFKKRRHSDKGNKKHH